MNTTTPTKRDFRTTSFEVTPADYDWIEQFRQRSGFRSRGQVLRSLIAEARRLQAEAEQS